ncbi:MAG: Eco57I restriction-modification methylase domain-containing protein [Gemmatimonadaceae bacterium]
MTPAAVPDPESLGALLDAAENTRRQSVRKLGSEARAAFGQYFTPTATARLMASLFQARTRRLRVLDAGAGVGSLSAALVAELCGRRERPRAIELTAYEIDETLIGDLRSTLLACERAADECRVNFTWTIRRSDFIREAVSAVALDEFNPSASHRYDAAILNPPYRKIRSDSEERRYLRAAGIETSNLYTGFLALTIRLLAPGGELVAITPRSFCNGPYFRPFRRLLLDTMRLDRIHVFERRDVAFRDEEVLQENVILRAVKRREAERSPQTVRVSSSVDAASANGETREVAMQDVVRPDDPEAFIHVVADEWGRAVASRMRALPATLDDLDLNVSTGRVVDFRARESLRPRPGKGTAPLIYPTHFHNDGYVTWPSERTRKPNAIVRSERTESLLIPRGWYVLVKRFSAKEERRRIVAAVLDPSRVDADVIGLENHLNYVHDAGHGLAPEMAKGLAAFLNCTTVDSFFRQFNGHTQVNATDLRTLRFPPGRTLCALGGRIGDAFPDQGDLDELVAAMVFKPQ